MTVDTRSAKSFLDLLEPVRHALYRYANHAAWRKDEAADIVQEAVMTAWRKFGQFQPGSNFRAWMFQILVNTLYRFNRRVGRQRELPVSESGFDAYESLEREEAWSVLLDEPDQLADLLDERLVQALDELAAGERQCLLLRLLEDFSYKEIAAMLQMPMGTAMSHVHRARMKLRESLAGMAVEMGWVRETA